MINSLASGGSKEPFVSALFSSEAPRTGTLKNPPTVSRVVVVGSGGLSIGQAGEFDYSGTITLSSHLLITI